MEELIIKHLFEGKTQQEISLILKNKGIKPNSLSSIEKTLKLIREKYKAKTMFHLAAILSKENLSRNKKGCTTCTPPNLPE